MKRDPTGERVLVAAAAFLIVSLFNPLAPVAVALADERPAGAFSTQLQFDQEAAWTYLVSQVEGGPRVPGTLGHALTEELIQEVLQQAGWETYSQNFTPTSGEAADIPLANIIGKRISQSPTGSSEIILAAHYDTRPWADRDSQGGSIHPPPATPIPGANDGASGVAVLLALAQALEGRNLTTNLTFLFIDGEDYGPDIRSMFYGSRYYVDHMTKDEIRRTSAMILLDMVGDSSLQIHREPGSNAQLTDEVFAEARAIGVETFIDDVGQGILDDHVYFSRVGIPAIDLIDFDYPDPSTNYWHTLEDDLDHVAAASLGDVGRVVESYLLTATLVEPTDEVPRPSPGPYGDDTVGDLQRLEALKAIAWVSVGGICALAVGLWLHQRRRGTPWRITESAAHPPLVTPTVARTKKT